MSGSRARAHVVVTAGPTREYVDPVRYLSNVSSGRMGFAIAALRLTRVDAPMETGPRELYVTGIGRR